MKQILQSLRNGDTQLIEVPAPQVKRGAVLIESRASLISLGTERMLVEFGQASLLDKARQQPDRVKEVLQKARTDGIQATWDAVQTKLDQPIPLGYCNAGVVLAVGEGVTDLAPGDRVVSNGSHAEVVCVPRNLCARIPDGVDFDEAAFTVTGAIGLQGIRLLEPTLGETIVVMGLGLIGLLSVQLLQAHGCKVIGTDFDPQKCRLAEQFGVKTVQMQPGMDAVEAIKQANGGREVDGVLITASTKSDDPANDAALVCRQRGRVVLVGVIGLKLNRNHFYAKEISFQVSCSYGPGRYDARYEQMGLDYPIGFVRWTEQRNFEAVLDQLQRGAMQVAPLITHRYPFANAVEAYSQISNREALGIVLNYEARTEIVAGTEPLHAWARRIELREPTGQKADRLALGAIGAGGFAGKVLLPAFAKAGADLRTICAPGGTNAAVLGRKLGFATATSELQDVLQDPEIRAVIVATPHNSHARLVHQAWQAGKAVFVEKPLCLTRGELQDVLKSYQNLRDEGLNPQVLVGFNRRFAPLVQEMKRLLSRKSGPISMVMNVNAGAIPAEHWTQDVQTGGGRIRGEGCHFIDLLRFLAGCPITEVRAVGMPAPSDHPIDTASIQLRFENGSIGTVHYFANGSKSLPKERLEVFASGSVMQLDNFRKLKTHQWPQAKASYSSSQDKGHQAEVDAFAQALREGQPMPIPFAELVEVTEATLEAAEQLEAQR
ncbi:MAG: bi-domain-containing oxidoreductase [Verrucomicrobiota bacterium JB022]|nr:bi-domain-containing oxidoreductase [Verrucomicrobiota bacterium JB022]